MRAIATTIMIFAATACGYYAADYNQSNRVDMADFAIFANAWMTTAADPNYNAACDTNDSNSIDTLDLITLADQWLYIADPGTEPNALPVTISTDTYNLTTITLAGTDDSKPYPPASLTYIITTLPTGADLYDPVIGKVVGTPHRLRGDTVMITGTTAGAKTFNYKASDGILESTEATVTATLTDSLSDCMIIKPGGYVTVADANDVDVTDKWAACCWIRTNRSNGTIFTKMSATAGVKFGLTAGRLKVDLRSNGTDYNITVPPAADVRIDDNAWHLVGVSVDPNSTLGTSLVTLISGATGQHQTTINCTGPYDNDQPLVIGGDQLDAGLDRLMMHRDWTGGNLPTGKYADEMSILQTLAGRNSTAYGSAELGYVGTSPYLEWRLDEGTGTTITSVGTSAQTGTINDPNYIKWQGQLEYRKAANPRFRRYRR